jgi:uncharacterized protein (TIGR02466 family)
MNIDFIFPQFVYRNFVDIDDCSIEKCCYELKSSSNGRVLSNIGGWQSDGMNVNGETLFFNSIAMDIKKLFHTLQISNLSFYLQNFWININGKHHYNRQHIHPGSFISGVLYIKAPKNCGNIFFVDPSSSLRNSFAYNFQVHDVLPMNNVFSGEWIYEPKDKLLILFPSWLEHYVGPNESDEDRISISFNIGVEK